MTHYETLMLARTEITEDEMNAIERQIDTIAASFKGKMSLFDRWGKYKLAYPVKKNMYGIYALARYEIPNESLAAFFKELDTLFRIKYNEIIMRQVSVKLEPGISSVYKYPEPVASHRTSNLDSFIKENKMEGLIDTPVQKPAEKKEEPPAKPVEEPAEKVSEPEKTEGDA